MPQRTANDVFELVNKEVLPRLKNVEGLAAEGKALAAEAKAIGSESRQILREGGLNGHAAEFKQLFEQALEAKERREAWASVRSDIWRAINPFRWVAGAIWLILTSAAALIIADLVHR